MLLSNIFILSKKFWFTITEGKQFTTTEIRIGTHQPTEFVSDDDELKASVFFRALSHVFTPIPEYLNGRTLYLIRRFMHKVDKIQNYRLCL